MREAAFVRQNKNKWTRFESALTNNQEVSPDELSELYLELTDHLSYARTFYPQSSTYKYLNALAGQAHRKIYRTKRTSSNKMLRFYKKDFPKEFYQYRKELLLVFLIFALFTAVGSFSAASDGGFVRSIMGDAYVNMTLKNIENNDPMAVYKKMHEMDMFLGITLNNIRVALLAFVLGIFLGVGTIFMIMQNAVMLGSFQYFFYEKGLFWESVRTIWIHGTIEISVIIVAGCAGLVVGKSILFPGTYTRLTSFTRGVKAGLKIVISTIPFFILAGFLEGFVTRHTEMPDWLALSVILFSLGLIAWYYIFYPTYLNHKPTYEHSSHTFPERT